MLASSLSAIVLCAFASQMRLPSSILYYHILTHLSLYNHSIYVKLLLQVIFILLCYLPLFYLLQKLLHLRRVIILIPQLLLTIFHRCLLLALTVVIIIFSFEASLCVTLFSPIEQEIRSFVDSISIACKDDDKCTVREVVNYINVKLSSSWNNPMSSLEIDNMLSQYDYWFLSVFGFNRAHVILWQGWGSCGQYATATAYLMNRLGYVVRMARFLDIDHGWAEVFINNTWYIVDPWYIGIVYKRQYQGDVYLVPASILASLENFRGYYRVLCEYLNATEIDCTNEHGY